MKRIWVVFLVVLLLTSGCNKQTKVEQPDQSQAFINLNTLLVYKENRGYTVVVNENGKTVKTVRFSSNRNSSEIQGLQLLECEDIGEYLGMDIDQLQEKLGPVHADVGSGFYIPSYVTTDAHLICFETIDDTVASVMKLDILSNQVIERRENRSNHPMGENYADYEMDNPAAEFNVAMDENPIDLAYNQRMEKAGTVQEMTEAERQSMQHWQAELQRSIDAYTQILTQEDADAFCELSQQYLKASEALQEFDAEYLRSEEYQIQLGTTSAWLLCRRGRESVRELTIHVKYLHYLYERANNAQPYTSLTFGEL